MTQTVKIEWAIKGYNHYRIRPHPDIGLLVQPENGNRSDSLAMKVMMPPLTEIPHNLHDIVTRDQDRRHPPPQTVEKSQVYISIGTSPVLHKMLGWVRHNV